MFHHHQIRQVIMTEFFDSSFPTENKTTIEVDGIVTEILCSSFSDRIFILITQINKVGTLLNAWAESKADGGKLFLVSTVMGRRDDPLLTIFARQLIEQLSEITSKPLLLGISLKPDGRSRDQFQAIINKALETVVS